MKTTIEIADPLFEAAKRRAALEKRSFRAIVEDALATFLDRHPRDEPFRLEKVSVRGKGLQHDVRDLPWEAIRGLASRGSGD